MGYLTDTCIFISKINTGSKIIKIAKHCSDVGKKFCVTDIVLNELRPGRIIRENKPKEAKISDDIVNALNFCQKGKILTVFDVGKIGKYKKNFDEIRKRYYGHLKDPRQLKKLILKGTYTKEEVRSKKVQCKDYGECSCIAVAMEEPEKYIIVSEDKGRVFLKEDIRLFEEYKKSHKIQVLDYAEWVNLTNYHEKSLEEIAVSKDETCIQ